MPCSIRQATRRDTDTAVEILREAARWLEERGSPMWRDGELIPTRLAGDADAGLVFIADCGGQPAGVVKFQLQDQEFWPDVPPNESAFVHRLAVRRKFAGGAVSSALLNWAVTRARSLGKKYVRLDCEASRRRLRAVYEKFGFVHHSDRQVGPYFVSRYEHLITRPATGPSNWQIVAAAPEHAASLTEIAFQAKRHWSYPEKWLELWRDELAVKPEFVTNNETYMAVENRRILGFYSLKLQADAPELAHLWVLPEAMGRGVGRALFLHAVSRARALNLRQIQIESDPNAEPFYERLGARRVSTVSREMDLQPREVPIMVYEIRQKTEFHPVHSEAQIAEVVRLAHEIWLEHYLPIIGRQQVDYMLEKFQSAQALAKQIGEGYEYYLGAQESLNSGYLAILTNPPDSTLLLSKLYVRTTARGAGLGKDMLKFVEDLCGKRGIKTIRLTVNKNNTAAIAWYCRMGFRNIGPVIADIGGGFIMDDFKLEKVL